MNQTNNKKTDVIETAAEVVNDVDKLEEAKKIMSPKETKEEKVPQTPPKEEKTAPEPKEKEPEIKVTIIIQNKNYAHYLRKTILSCIIQDFPKDQYEIIGYDANSDDKSMEVYNRFKGRIKVVEVGDKWQASALNEIIKKHAKGRYIAVINSDDWLLPHFVKIHANALDESPEDVVMAYSNAYRQFENGARNVYEPKDKDKKLIPKDEIFKSNFVFQSSTMIRRSALDKIGLFDEKLKHAWDYKAWVELAKIGKWAYIDSVTTVYRIHPQMGSIAMRSEAIKDVIKIIVPKGMDTKEDKEKVREYLKNNFGLPDEECERYIQ